MAFQVPIGEPVFNSTAYVLDDKLQPVDSGQVGQLFVSSPNVAVGYCGRNMEGKVFMESDVS